ncbi:carbohydrate ABC transporter permease [Mongoliimonas terrestris]|uniref:carbohydrate ABC transporter permease n=1 Tax=Mongoliimonas terrestris TaxID=1709001 RepID=UPI001FDA3504|nr:sugar ABC transporter permease [Mongoliimonas terrestris]
MAPAGLLIFVFIIAPFLLSLGLSFTNQRLVPNPNLPTSFQGFSNYLRLFGNAEFWQSFRNTFTFALLVVPLQSALALGAAMLVNSRLPARNVFRGIFFLPTVLTMVVVVVIWSNLFQINGFFNAVIQAVTFGAHPGFDWLANPALAMPSIVLVSVWQGFGFQMVIYLAGLQGINPELYEAARVDGASRWQEFWAVTMPGLRNTHIFVVVTTTILALKLFAQVDLLTKGGPLGSTQTVVRLIYETGFRKGQVGVAAALSVVFFLVVLAISVGQRVFLKEDREVA